jgi:hypothetical protein
LSLALRIPLQVEMAKKIALASFMIFFLVMLYLSTTERRKERLGTFREDAKTQIGVALREVCVNLAKASAGRCGEVSWGGKHRWFGRVLLKTSSIRPTAEGFTTVVKELGWSLVGTSAGVTEFGGEDLELSFYAVEGTVQGFTVTTNR